MRQLKGMVYLTPIKVHFAGICRMSVVIIIVIAIN